MTRVPTALPVLIFWAGVAASTQLAGCSSSAQSTGTAPDAAGGTSPTTAGGGGSSPAASGAPSSGGGSAAGSSGTQATTLASISVTSMPSTACTTAHAAPSDGLNSLAVNGVARGFIFHVPPSYDGQHALPLVMAFHGKGDMAANLDGYNFLFQKVGGADNVLVYPQALPDPNLQNQPSFERDPADDLLFIDALLASLEESVCFDTARVFAIGHSLGSTFVQTLACQRGDVIRAIAPQAGDPGMTTGCTGPVAAWVGYGLQDSAGEVAASKARKDFWLTSNHCNLSSEAPGDPSPPCLQYACDAGYPVEWCEDPAGTHKWSPWMTQSIFDFFGAFVP